MRRKLLLSIIFLLIATLLPAVSFFSDYDFTFYKTVFNALKGDKSTIALDYTGFGFITSKSSNGLFMRIGLKAPYSSLANLIPKKAEDTSVLATEIGSPSDSQQIPLDSGNTSLISTEHKDTEDLIKKDFTFTMILGPAWRYIITPFLDTYAGIGMKIEEHILIETNKDASSEYSAFDTTIAADFDIGVKFNLERNASCRIGLYGSYDLLSYTYSTVKSSVDGKETVDQSTSNVHINMIAYGKARTPLSTIGYISMGKTFSSRNKQYEYRYENTTSKVGGGIITTAENS